MSQLAEKESQMTAALPLMFPEGTKTRLCPTLPKPNLLSALLSRLSPLATQGRRRLRLWLAVSPSESR